MTLPFSRQFPESGNPLPNELFFFEQERVEGRISDDQGEYLMTGQSGTEPSGYVVNELYSLSSRCPLRRPKILLSPLRGLGMVADTAFWAGDHRR
jgi:hypothetical protein